jgi:prepilin-type processing-associated H-X9-DG protein
VVFGLEPGCWRKGVGTVSGRQKRRDRVDLRGFTILELLLVAGLVTVLLGLFLPALRSSRQRAGAVACLSNLRSLASASVAYSGTDSSGVLIPVHPQADSNIDHTDGFFDFGGSDGAADVWAGRLAAGGEWAGSTRPLNAFLGLPGGVDQSHEAFRCPSDRPFDPPIAYDEWKVWSEAFRTRGVFAVVGTSYWGNAVRTDRLPDGTHGPVTYSFGVYLRRMERIAAPGATVLYMEMPGLFNMARVDASPRGVKFRSLGIDGWHGEGPRFNFAFCDGHAEGIRVPAACWMPEPQSSREALLRRGALRFDCYPDAPIVDPPVSPRSSATQQHGAAL